MAPHFSVLVWETLWTEEPGSPWGCKELDTTEATKYTAHMTHLDSSYIPRSTQVYSRNFKCNSNAFIIKVFIFQKVRNQSIKIIQVTHNSTIRIGC